MLLKASPPASTVSGVTSCQKVRYGDRVAALLALARTGRKKRSARPKDERRAYPCPDCRGWHLTSK